ncbi:MAG: hypothetical protein KDH88_08680 [Chromatiales bacterium]|nr:hypothetical protein [Chromatiales bacterium]
MFDFVFFNATLEKRFVSRLAGMGIKRPVRLCEDDVWTVRLVDELDDLHMEELETYYDELLSEQERITDAEDADMMHRVGVQFTRANGEIGMVRLDPDLVNRIGECLSLSELQVLVQQVADAVIDPEYRRLCQP